MSDAQTNIPIDDNTPPKVVYKTITRELAVVLSSKEINVVAREVGRKTTLLRSMQDAKKAEGIRRKAEIDEVDSDIKRMCTVLESGKELRPVECREFFESGSMVVMRVDTAERISIRPASMQDRQIAFGGLGGESADTSHAPDDDSMGDLAAASRNAAGDGATADEPAESDGTGIVRDDTGERVGAVVSSSVGAGVFVGDGSEDGELAPGQRDPEDQGESVIEYDDGPPEDRGVAIATIGEAVAAKEASKRKAGKPKAKAAKPAPKAKPAKAKRR
jgi:hypothetical protein